MEKFKTLLLILLLGQASLAIGQTQAEITNDSAKRLRKAESELASIYNKILTAYSEDKEFVINLKESQDAWTKFRAVELKMKYPDREPGYYGSAHQMCVNDYLTELTNERAKRLQNWLSTTVEGDVCSGSIQVQR